MSACLKGEWKSREIDREFKGDECDRKLNINSPVSHIIEAERDGESRGVC
jgi:hypothetical protein